MRRIHRGQNHKLTTRRTTRRDRYYRRKLLVYAGEYDPDAVNASIPPDEILNNLRSYITNQRVETQMPVNMLFWGDTGTGKTAFAGYIAESLDMKLMTKRASDLLSMWVGGTEQNIRHAFEEAGRENALLLLDEADSFYIDRRTAGRSWHS